MLLCIILYEILGSSAVQDQEDLLHVFLMSIWLHNRYTQHNYTVWYENLNFMIVSVQKTTSYVLHKCLTAMYISVIFSCNDM